MPLKTPKLPAKARSRNVSTMARYRVRASSRSCQEVHFEASQVAQSRRAGDVNNLYFGA
jgi:hypothetical protein